MFGDRLWRAGRHSRFPEDFRAFRKDSSHLNCLQAHSSSAAFFPADPMSRNCCGIAMNITTNSANEVESFYTANCRLYKALER